VKALSNVDLIRADGLTKDRLGPIDFNLAAAEILGIVGPHGVGKTTLLRLIWGFLRPDRGSLRVFELQPHLSQIAVRLRAGFVSQSPQFHDWMTAHQHLEFDSEFYETSDQEHARALLHCFRIDPQARIARLPRESRATLALVGALRHKPSLLLLDEVLAGLSPSTRWDMISFLRGLSKSSGVGIVISARNAEDLGALPDRFLQLHAVEKGD
jgi:ABC-2 type transport system ATP-binding protein